MRAGRRHWRSRRGAEAVDLSRAEESRLGLVIDGVAGCRTEGWKRKPSPLPAPSREKTALGAEHGNRILQNESVIVGNMASNGLTSRAANQLVLRQSQDSGGSACGIEPESLALTEH